jgi:threonylcarbamoyladenosine tRNA methylthiotransferase MtaB
MGRVSFYTLGCKLNFAETGAIQRDFEDRRFEVVPFGEPADVTVINTCTVTSEAERKCRQIIRRALRANPHTFVAVTGCYAQIRPGDIASIEGVDAVLGANEKFKLFSLIESFTKREMTQVSVSCIDDVASFGPAFSSDERTRAFLKVQDGCDYTCAFCTIPMARGRSRSQRIDVCVRQAEVLADEGFSEIVLSGVNIGLFGQDTGQSLLDLLRALDRVEGVQRYRISSIEPNLLTDDIVDFVAESRAFQPHFHLPLQSGDDHVLGRMRRRYRREVYTHRVERIIERLPDAAIGVDVIVGFPAEGETEFENTRAYLADLPIAYMHVFTYSERPDTVAVDQIDRVGGTPVPHAERSRRNRELRMLSARKTEAFYRANVGTTRPVLWEAGDHGDLMQGFTDNYVRVSRPAEAARRGSVEDVVLSHLADDGTVAVDEFVALSVI